MSIITLPSGLCVGADGGFSWGQQRYDVTGVSDAGGASQTRLFGPPRWTLSMRCPPYVDNASAADWQAMLLSLRGRVNHLAAYDIARPLPRGTMRGQARISAYLAAGSTSMTLVGATAGTLKKNDALQISSGVGTSHYARVTQDATSSPAADSATTWTNTAAQTVTWTNTAGQTVSWARTGSISISFEPPTRIAFQAYTAVTLEYPLAYFKATSDGTSWTYYSTGAVQDLRFDGLEDFST